jgi:hypothetical protein
MARTRLLGALAVAAVPFVVGQGVAAAAFAESEQSLTFTYQGQQVLCHLYGQSDVVSGEGSATSSTNATDDPRCVGVLAVTVNYVDDGGVRRTSGATTGTGSDVSTDVQGVRDSFSATHTVRFTNCDEREVASCSLTFTTSPK